MIADHIQQQGFFATWPSWSAPSVIALSPIPSPVPTAVDAQPNAGLHLCGGLLVNALAPVDDPQALLTMLYRSTDRLCGAALARTTWPIMPSTRVRRLHHQSPRAKQLTLSLLDVSFLKMSLGFGRFRLLLQIGGAVPAALSVYATFTAMTHVFQRPSGIGELNVCHSRWITGKGWAATPARGRCL